jgi:hypothetical protein
MKTLTIESIEAEKLAATKKAETEAQNKALLINKGLADIESIYYTHCNGFGFGWSSSKCKPEQVSRIVAAFPPNGKNYEVKFASSEKNFITDSCVVVKWNNSDSCPTNSFKIHYTSGEHEINIEVPLSHFSAHVYFRNKQGKHRGFGRYDVHRYAFIDYFYTQSFSGGYNVLYFLEGAESLTEYLNFVFSGSFKYDGEL